MAFQHCSTGPTLNRQWIGALWRTSRIFETVWGKTMNTIRYKDYISTIEYDEDMEMFHGRVANIRDVVSFYGKSVDELKTEMKKSVDEYISFCEGRGIQPSKRYSGRLNLRTDPKLHGRLAQVAAEHGKSLNAWALEQLEHATHA